MNSLEASAMNYLKIYERSSVYGADKSGGRCLKEEALTEKFEFGEKLIRTTAAY